MNFNSPHLLDCEIRGTNTVVFVELEQVPTIPLIHGRVLENVVQRVISILVQDVCVLHTILLQHLIAVSVQIFRRIQRKVLPNPKVFSDGISRNYFEHSTQSFANPESIFVAIHTK